MKPPEASKAPSFLSPCPSPYPSLDRHLQPACPCLLSFLRWTDSQGRPSPQHSAGLAVAHSSCQCLQSSQTRPGWLPAIKSHKAAHRNRTGVQTHRTTGPSKGLSHLGLCTPQQYSTVQYRVLQLSTVLYSQQYSAVDSLTFTHDCQGWNSSIGQQ